MIPKSCRLFGKDHAKQENAKRAGEPTLSHSISGRGSGHRAHHHHVAAHHHHGHAVVHHGRHAPAALHEHFLGGLVHRHHLACHAVGRHLAAHLAHHHGHHTAHHHRIHHRDHHAHHAHARHFRCSGHYLLRWGSWGRPAGDAGRQWMNL